MQYVRADLGHIKEVIKEEMLEWVSSTFQLESTMTNYRSQQALLTSILHPFESI